MSAFALGCTQNLDGSLKDASQIIFFNDDDGHISAGESAANRMEVLITELHEQGYGLEGLEADDEDEDGEDDEYMTAF
jgi:hypothetical protein